MAISKLWNNVNYRTPIKYFINTYIREYDLSKANISALLDQGRISMKQYEEYYNMDKRSREVSIGKWIKEDKTIYESIQTGIKKAKELFIESNQIDDYNIVSIKNDALFIHSISPSIMTFEPRYEFKIKGEYTMYLQLQDLEVYYKDFVNSNGELGVSVDVKGISDEKLSRHSNGMLDLICEVCYRLQRENPKDTLQYLSSMYDQFIQRQLPVSYYRSFDFISGYLINTRYTMYSVDVIDDSEKFIVDINRNLSILRDLMYIASNEYRLKIRK